jgi:hypothetical protein
MTRNDSNLKDEGPPMLTHKERPNKSVALFWKVSHSDAPPGFPRVDDDADFLVETGYSPSNSRKTIRESKEFHEYGLF